MLQERKLPTVRYEADLPLSSILVAERCLSHAPGDVGEGLCLSAAMASALLRTHAQAWGREYVETLIEELLLAVATEPGMSAAELDRLQERVWDGRGEAMFRVFSGEQR